MNKQKRRLKKGYILDYLTGEEVKSTPEEVTRQIFEKRLVEEYGYSKGQIKGAGQEFYIKKGKN